MIKWKDFVFWLTIKPRLKRLQRLLPEAQIYPAGSRYTCDPPRFGTDVDFLIYSEHGVLGKLLKAGYVQSLKNDYQFSGVEDKEFTAHRKGVVNLIVTHSTAYRDSFMAGTLICKEHNVQNKWHRIVIHETMRGHWKSESFSDDFDRGVRELLGRFTGPYRKTLIKAYLAQRQSP